MLHVEGANEKLWSMMGRKTDGNKRSGEKKVLKLLRVFDSRLDVFASEMF